MTKIIPQFLLAAPSSGSGKTTVCRGLMAALTRQGYRVQPYKCGPDYIDTKFHSSVCGRPSVNLDTFMSSPTHVRQLYSFYAQQAEVCIVEGMMGLFDGYERDKGSSAEIAALLNLPVVLVVDARSAAYSLAALLSGFLNFRKETRIAGVIFNRTGSERHCRMLRDVCTDLHVPCFGYLPKDAVLEQKSRYLGLDFRDLDHLNATNYLIELIEKSIDIPKLLQSVITSVPSATDPFPKAASKPLQITVAKDEDAFSFIYTAHMEILSRLGEIHFIDPLKNEPLPANTDFLYLPGGYPEKYATSLAEATVTRDTILQYIEQGGRALAECGGMIYLSKGIYLEDTPDFVPLVGAFPFLISNRKVDRKLSLGYRSFSYQGQLLKGHEFHYTQFAQPQLVPTSAATLYNARGKTVPTSVFRYKNLFASYTHLYWGEIDLLSLFS